MSKLSNIEQEMFEAIVANEVSSQRMDTVKAVVSVAKKYILEAAEEMKKATIHHLAYSSAVYIYPQDYPTMANWMKGATIKQWLKENGIE